MSVTTTWNPMTHTDYDTLKGKEVFSANGESVGTIAGTFHPNMDMPAARGHLTVGHSSGLMCVQRTTPGYRDWALRGAV